MTVAAKGVTSFVQWCLIVLSLFFSCIFDEFVWNEVNRFAFISDFLSPDFSELQSLTELFQLRLRLFQRWKHYVAGFPQNFESNLSKKFFELTEYCNWHASDAILIPLCYLQPLVDMIFISFLLPRSISPFYPTLWLLGKLHALQWFSLNKHWYWWYCFDNCIISCRVFCLVLLLSALTVYFFCLIFRKNLPRSWNFAFINFCLLYQDLREQRNRKRIYEPNVDTIETFSNVGLKLGCDLASMSWFKLVSVYPFRQEFLIMSERPLTTWIFESMFQFQSGMFLLTKWFNWYR